MSESHVYLPGSRRPAKKGGVRVSAIDPNSQVEVTVTVKAPALPEKMPAYPLTPAQFAEQYGADPTDIRKVEKSLRAFGLTVEKVTNGGRNLSISGSAAAMEAASTRAVIRGVFRGREGANYDSGRARRPHHWGLRPLINGVWLSANPIRA